MAQILENNITGVVQAATTIGVGVTSCLISWDNFPSALVAPDYFLLTITDEVSYEIVKVTTYVGLTSNVAVMERAQEGTTDQAWAAGDRVSVNVTSATINEAITSSLAIDTILTSAAGDVLVDASGNLLTDILR